MDPLSGRVAVVTGGAGGIGMALARAFAARGAKLVLADLDDAALDRATTALASEGATVHAVPTDVGDLASVQALADAAERRYGAVHVVCNNAGIALFGEIAQATHKDWDYTMRVNFWGVVHGVETFVPRLIAQGQGGHIVNTASMAGLVGMQWLGVYCASKFAVVGLTEALNRELAPHDIGVSVLCPMIVETNINANSLRNRPATLRNPDHTDAPPDIEAGTMAGSVIKVEEVARRVVRAIDRKDLYILTHPEQREILRRRARRQDQMFEPDRW
jgi:NAD(P)-dependent dehydrogenase (short-subunit alcohol dehydrogenase family)